MGYTQSKGKNQMRKKLLTIIFSSLFIIQLPAEIILLSPADGKTVERVPENQKKIMACKNRKERLALLAADRKAKKEFFSSKAAWRVAKSITFKWKVTANENGPYKVVVSPNEDFSQPCHSFFADRNSNGKFQTSARTWGLQGNLEAGRKYFWRVISYDFHNNKKTVSATGTFFTAPDAPRHIRLEGRTANVRDIGAWKTSNGTRVKQGMLFRGEGLNNNSPDRETEGRNRLTMADQSYMLDVLKIQTDLDLRGFHETVAMKGSPLGNKVQFINIPCPAYRGLFREDGKKSIRDIFRVFCKKENYPIYFHCIGGVDRTGAVAFILNGLLGVSQNDLEIDWEHSFYPDLPDDPSAAKPNYGRSIMQVVKGMMKYGEKNDTMQKRIELYLKSCGITDDEIASFRSIMEGENVK